MTVERNDYDVVADLYDAFVQIDFDLEFFRQLARDCGGPLLELMAGTGRATRALHEGCSDLTCVDLSLEMLRVLRGKLADRTPAPLVVCADVRALPLADARFEMAVIPFNSFAELTWPEDQRAGLAEVNRVLAPGGTFVCTLHNPAVRRRTLDGQTRERGSFELEDGGRLQLIVRGTLDDATGLAVSEQTYRLYDPAGSLRDERRQTVRFALLTRDGFVDLADGAGFEPTELAGDYDGSPFADDSTYMIWRLKKRG